MDNKLIDTSGLDTADVLIALYERSKPLGLGFLHYDPKPMDKEEASALLGESKHFDYLKGRVMKVSLDDPAGFNPWLYDRDNGAGAAERAIASIRAKAAK